MITGKSELKYNSKFWTVSCLVVTRYSVKVRDPLWRVIWWLSPLCLRKVWGIGRDTSTKPGRDDDARGLQAASDKLPAPWGFTHRCIRHLCVPCQLLHSIREAISNRRKNRYTDHACGSFCLAGPARATGPVQTYFNIYLSSHARQSQLMGISLRLWSNLLCKLPSSHDTSLL